MITTRIGRSVVALITSIGIFGYTYEADAGRSDSICESMDYVLRDSAENFEEIVEVNNDVNYKLPNADLCYISPVEDRDQVRLASYTCAWDYTTERYSVRDLTREAADAFRSLASAIDKCNFLVSHYKAYDSLQEPWGEPSAAWTVRNNSSRKVMLDLYSEKPGETGHGLFSDEEEESKGERSLRIHISTDFEN